MILRENARVATADLGLELSDKPNSKMVPHPDIQRT